MGRRHKFSDCSANRKKTRNDKSNRRITCGTKFRYANLRPNALLSFFTKFLLFVLSKVESSSHKINTYLSTFKIEILEKFYPAISLWNSNVFGKKILPLYDLEKYSK